MVGGSARRRRLALRHEAVELVLVLGLAQAFQMIAEGFLLLIKLAALFLKAGKLRALVVVEGGIA